MSTRSLIEYADELYRDSLGVEPLELVPAWLQVAAILDATRGADWR